MTWVFLYFPFTVALVLGSAAVFASRHQHPPTEDYRPSRQRSVALPALAAVTALLLTLAFASVTMDNALLSTSTATNPFISQVNDHRSFPNRTVEYTAIWTARQVELPLEACNGIFVDLDKGGTTFTGSIYQPDWEFRYSHCPSNPKAMDWIYKRLNVGGHQGALSLNPEACPIGKDMYVASDESPLPSGAPICTITSDGRIAMYALTVRPNSIMVKFSVWNYWVKTAPDD